MTSLKLDTIVNSLFEGDSTLFFFFFVVVVFDVFVLLRYFFLISCNSLRKFSLYSEINFNVSDIIRQCLASQPINLSFRPGWIQLKNIFSAVLEYDDLWKEANKSQQKRMALTDLLKKLESSGLSRHKPVHIGVNDQSLEFFFPS